MRGGKRSRRLNHGRDLTSVAVVVSCLESRTEAGREILLLVAAGQLRLGVETVSVADEARDDVQVEVKKVLVARGLVVLPQRDTVRLECPLHRTRHARRRSTEVD